MALPREVLIQKNSEPRMALPGKPADYTCTHVIAQPPNKEALGPLFCVVPPADFAYE